MSKVRVQNFAVSIDGYGAGPNQDLGNPIGVGGVELMEWFFPTRTWRRMHGQPEGETGVDDDFAAQGMRGLGAWILGRNMFGPIRGPWPDDSWKGWWGDEPPYHVPVFVLTHHARPPIDDGRRHDVPFRHRRHPRRARARDGGGRRRRTCASAAASRRSGST